MIELAEFEDVTGKEVNMVVGGVTVPMQQPVFFKDKRLQSIALEIMQYDSKSASLMFEAKTKVQSAFQARWHVGKLLHENYEYIVETCGSQKEFAEKFGYPEGVISNNKRAYKALYDEGCRTWEEVVALLSKRNIVVSVSNFEKIATLLANPDRTTKPIDRRARDERRLEDIYSEADEILRRNSNKNLNIVEKALEVKERTEAIKDRINALDPYRSVWKNHKYLQWVKSLKVDMLTGFPQDFVDPHHTLPNGSSGGIGAKVPDCFVIPVSRETHNMIESGDWNPTVEELAEALVKTMALFIQTHFPNEA